MAWDKLDSARIEQIIRQITGKSDKSTDMVAPAIKGSVSYILGTHQKTLKVNRGISVHVVSYEMDEKDKFIYDGYNLLAIHPDDLEEIGFN